MRKKLIILNEYTMIKKTFVAALAILAAGSVSAQTLETSGNEEYSVDKYKVETNRFWSNWFVSVGGGVNMYFGDHDRQMKFGDRLAPALDVAIGKWFTPGIGVRVMYSGLSISGATQNGSHSNGKPISGKPWQGYWLEEQDFDFFNIHADVMFNMSNLLCGYNEKRIWNCSPYIGVGWAHVWDKPSTREVSMNVGILNSFRITSSLDINLDIRGMLVNDRFDGEVGQAKEDGLLTATVGLTYKFPLRGWNHVKNVEPVDMAALNALRQKVDQLSRDNERLQRKGKGICGFGGGSSSGKRRRRTDRRPYGRTEKKTGGETAAGIRKRRKYIQASGRTFCRKACSGGGTARISRRGCSGVREALRFCHQQGEGNSGGSTGADG